jgi:HK97 family phage major capsid protein
MSKSVKGMRQEKEELINAGRKLLDSCKQEDNTRRSLTDEERSTYDNYTTQIDILNDDIETNEREEKQASLEVRQKAPVSKPFTPQIKKPDGIEWRKSFGSWLKGESDSESRAKQSMYGFAPNQDEIELRSGMLTTTSGDGADYIPQNFHAELEVYLKYYCKILNECRVINTPNGRLMPYPVLNDTANGATVVTEGSAITELDPTTSAVNFTSRLLSSEMIQISLQMLEDVYSASAFDSAINEALAVRIGRSLDTAIVGSTSAPKGIIASATAGNSISAEPEFTDVLNLLASMDYAYADRPSTCFLMNPAVYYYLAGLTSTTGNFLWRGGLESLDEGQDLRLFGKKVILSPTMPTTGKVIIALDTSKAIVRQVGGITYRRSAERYWELGMVAVTAFLRYDFAFIGPATSCVYMNYAGGSSLSFVHEQPHDNKWVKTNDEHKADVRQGGIHKAPNSTDKVKGHVVNPNA